MSAWRCFWMFLRDAWRGLLDMIRPKHVSTYYPPEEIVRIQAERIKELEAQLRQPCPECAVKSRTILRMMDDQKREAPPVPVLGGPEEGAVSWARLSYAELVAAQKPKPPGSITDDQYEQVRGKRPGVLASDQRVLMCHHPDGNPPLTNAQIMALWEAPVSTETLRVGETVVFNGREARVVGVSCPPPDDGQDLPPTRMVLLVADGQDLGWQEAALCRRPETRRAFAAPGRSREPEGGREPCHLPVSSGPALQPD